MSEDTQAVPNDETPAPTTRAAAEEWVRSMPRHCRGIFRLKITAKDYARMSEPLQDALAAVTTSDEKSEKLEQLNAGELKARLLADGRRQESIELDDLLRPGCGYDFNETICAGPFDGAVHDYTCPDCGATGIYQAPRFELTDDDKPGA